MTGIVIDIGGGQIVEFPDEATAQQYFAGQGGGQPATPTPERRTGLAGFFLGDNDPNTMNAGERLGQALNAGGESMTLGLVGDEADAAARSLINGQGYDANLQRAREREAQFAEETPIADAVSRIGGALLPAFLTRGATTPQTGGLLRRSAVSGAQGAGMGGLYGFMEGEGGFRERLGEGGVGGLIGGAIGAAIPGVGAGIQALRNSRAANRGIREAARGAPSTEELRAVGQAAYRQVDDAGVHIRPESFNRFVGELDQTLTANGLDNLPGPGSLTPRAARVNEIARQMGQGLDEASRPVPGALPGPGVADPASVGLPFSSLDQLRRHAGTAARQPNPDAATDAALGMRTITELDNFVNRLGPEDVVAGDVEALQGAIPRARELWRTMTRSQLVDDAIEAGENYTGGTASGLRNQFASLLRNQATRNMFSEAERRAMRRVVNGSIPQQMLNLAGSGLGNMAQIGTGFGAGGLPGAFIGAGTAAGTRYGANYMASRNADLVRRLMANGGMQTLPSANPAITRTAEGLMLQGGAVNAQ